MIAWLNRAADPRATFCRRPTFLLWIPTNLNSWGEYFPFRSAA
jgi:hypothetical protein